MVYPLVIVVAGFAMFSISHGLPIGSGFESKNPKERRDWTTTRRTGLDTKLKYNADVKWQNEAESSGVVKTSRNLLQEMNLYDGVLKTSLNIELGKKSIKNSNRHRRKIAVKMISDITSEKIDDLLKLFNEKYGIENHNDADEGGEDNEEYNDLSLKTPSAADLDYMYENLYEDEKDLDVPVKSRLNSEFGSLQDLILQATRNYWEREMDETRLYIPSNKNFF
ncbi:uncharacterized protein LOC106094528 [Stomoxys calcitrans]|uniref:Uncharacterized protein n=1 Tax=Stomoxys calcitrans TaxID=35570 RepID=A0A1I8PN56_STOCA|nr:uncharacterized protein LOC106094528 [Stomoxys calcitrans]